MKIFKIAGVSALVLALILGIAAPVLAAPDLAELQAINVPTKVLTGKVVEKAVDDDGNPESFIIESGRGEITISVDENTRYVKSSPPQKAIALARKGLELKQQIRERLEQDLQRHQAEIKQRIQERLEQALPEHLAGLKQRIQERLEQALPEYQPEPKEQRPEELAPWNWRSLHPFAEEVSFDDLTPETRVLVRVVPGEDNPLAKLVIILEPTAYYRVTGTITDISPADNTITITPTDDGVDVVLKYNDKTRFILRGIIGLEEGQSVRAVYDDEMTTHTVVAPIEAPEVAE